MGGMKRRRVGPGPASAHAERAFDGGALAQILAAQLAGVLATAADSATGADTAVMPASTASSRTATPRLSTLPASASPTAELRRVTRWPSQLT